jgi:hypothetical protein
MRITDGRLAAIAICARRYASGLCRRVEFEAIRNDQHASALAHVAVLRALGLFCFPLIS